MAATVGALRVTLGANTANFEAGMRRAKKEAASSATAIQRSLAGIKGGFAAATAGLVSTAAVAGLFSLTKRALDYAASLQETAEQLGVTTDALQVFRFAATQVGVSQDEMDTGLRKLSDSISEAGQGTKAQAEAFNELGVNVKTASGELKSTDRVIREMADGFAGLKNKQDQVRIATDLMGRSGAKLVPLLSGGAKAVDGLTESARELGVVLNQEQIKNADKVADKLAEIKQVLEARIAGVVSDNAASILELANALATLAIQAANAASAWLQYQRAIGGGRQPGSSLAGQGILSGTPIGLAAGIPAAINNFFRERRERATEVGVDLTSPIKPFVPAASATGLNRIAGGGGRKGGGGRSAESIANELERKRKEALQDAYNNERAIADAKADELKAQQNLLTDYVDRSEIEHQLIDHEIDQQNKALDLAVKLGDMDAITAEQVKSSNERLRILRKQEVNQQLELDRQRDFERTQETVFGIQRDLLQAQSQLAETAAERRRVELQILDLAYRERKERLERIVAESKDFEEVKRARMELQSLPAQRAADTGVLMQGTRGPLEEFQASLPTTADKMNEALQSVAANGLRALEDGILSVIDGTKSLGEAFREMASQIISDLLRIQIQRAIIGPLSNLLGSAIGVSAAGGASVASSAGAGLAAAAGGFASGGFTGYMPRRKVAGFVHGQEFVFDADATNRIGRDNLEALRSGKGMAPAKNTHQNFNMTIVLPSGLSPKQQRETGTQFAAGFQSRIAVAKRQGF